MAKINLTTIAGGYASTDALNDNFDAIEDGFDNTLSRDGTTPNSMTADLDMNSNKVINLAAPDNDNDAARRVDLTDLTTFTDTTLPAQAGNANRVLGTNGTVQAWTLATTPVANKAAAAAMEPVNGAAIVVLSDDGDSRVFTGITGLIGQADNGGSYCGTQITYDATAVWRDLKHYNTIMLPEWCGAVGDGTTDDFAAIQLAINSLTLGVVIFTKDTYFASGTLGGKTGVSLLSKTGSTIKGDSALTSLNRMLTYTDCSNFSIKGITFDADNAIATAGGDATESSVRMLRCSDFTIEHNKIYKYVKIGLICDSVSDFYIGKNRIDRDAAVDYTSHAINVSSNFSGSIRGVIEKNLCQNNGSIFHGRWLDILYNQFYDSGYGAGVATVTNSGAYLSQNYLIIGNVCADGTGVDDDGFEIRGIENLAPFSVIQSNLCYSNAGNGIDNFGKHCIINSNTCFDNGKQAAGVTTQCGIRSMKSASIVAQRGSNCIISNNRCFDTLGTGGGGTQLYGYTEAGSAGDLTEIVYSGNNFLNNDTGEVILASLRPSYDARTLEFSETWDPVSLVPGAFDALAVTAAGAEFGDFVEVSFSNSILSQTLSGFVSSADTVTVVLANTTITNRDVASGTVYIRLRKNWLA